MGRVECRKREVCARTTRLTKGRIDDRASLLGPRLMATRSRFSPEESRLSYRIVPVNISAGDQFKPEFLKPHLPPDPGRTAPSIRPDAIYGRHRIWSRWSRPRAQPGWAHDPARRTWEHAAGPLSAGRCPVRETSGATGTMSVRLTHVNPRQCAFANVLRTGSRHKLPYVVDLTIIFITGRLS
jgi:hypothetical protein